MTERILDKIDRLGAEAGILVMTAEIRRFALLIRADMLKTIQCPICKAEDSPYPKCGCVTYVEEKP